MKKTIIIAGLIAVLGGIYFFYYKGRKLEAKYNEHKVIRGDIELTILATGTVQPKNRLEIKAPVAGRIEEVLVKEGQTVRKGEIIAWMSSTERAAMLDAARSKGEAEYKKWSELYLPTPVLAPIKGTIILKSVEPGQTFTNTDAIFTMSDHLTVKAQVDETDIAQIKLKSKALIVLDAYPKSPVAGHVDQLAFDATTTNNVTTYAIDVLPESTPAFMRSGMTANVTFTVESKSNVVLIPAEALKVLDGKSYVLQKNGKAPVQKIVVTGISDGKQIEIKEGLAEEEIILIPDYSINETAEDSHNPFSPKFPRRQSGGKR